MAPTSEVETRHSPSSIQSDSSSLPVCPRRTSGDPFDIAFSLYDSDNSCETYFCSRDVSPSPRPVIPQASPAFRQVMGKLKSERPSDADDNNTKTMSPTSPPSTPTSSLSQKLKSSLIISSSVSPSLFLTPNHRTNPSSKPINVQKKSRRPASFGGADVVKPRTERRASHYEKRVSWADEGGSDHQLINVRLIRPRLTMDAKKVSHSTPGQSILRNSGAK